MYVSFPWPFTLTIGEITTRRESTMYGIFGAYTRWAVVFLIIFVLFFLLVPGYYGAGAGAGDP
jgi:hypothetical protein